MFYQFVYSYYSQLVQCILIYLVLICFSLSSEKRDDLKGHVDLTNVKVVEKVADTAFDKPSFQIVHGDLTLYVITNDEREREEWIELIRQCKFKNYTMW